MPLIVEDGSVVENANTYVTREEIIAFANTRNIELNLGSPADESRVDALAIAAMDYLETYRGRYKGTEVQPGIQPLSWPRKNVYIGNYLFPSNKVPTDIKSVQCWLSIYINRGVELMPVGNTSAFVKREKIGPIETEYSEAIELAAGTLPSMPQVDALLGPYLDGGFGLRTVRI